MNTMSKKALIVTRVSGFVPQFEMNNVKILQEMGYEVHYAANFDMVVYGGDNKRLEGTGIHTHHIPFGRSPFSRAVLRRYRELKQLMLQENFDLVHCHMPMTGILARKAAEKVRRLTGKNVPVIYTAHGFHFYTGAPLGNWIYYLAERHYARYTDILVVINEEDRMRAGKFPVRGTVEYVPGVGIREEPESTPGYDLHKEYNIDKKNKVVVSVGELTERKNHGMMIHAMDRFRRDDIVYLICGTGPLEEKLRSMVREMHMGDKVIFAGYCDHIADVLRQADMFAFPSKQEGLPVALMEAMRAGLPVLAYDTRGNHDLIINNSGGFLVEDDLPEEYAARVRYFLDYPDVAERMGNRNKERVKDFLLPVVEQKMRRIYEMAESGVQGAS